MNEEPVSGSSVSIDKGCAIIEDEDSGLDSKSMLYKDTYVVAGSGVAVILIPKAVAASKIILMMVMDLKSYSRGYMPMVEYKEDNCSIHFVLFMYCRRMVKFSVVI